ncbi:hypothetical protein DFH11DRAFT_1540246 [Phellopilus nigrolimitatus]|nr:hypothetical protein DFH11DRAFT_1540246 [Phellopilus nigrolimitatus]
MTGHREAEHCQTQEAAVRSVCVIEDIIIIIEPTCPMLEVLADFAVPHEISKQQDSRERDFQTERAHRRRPSRVRQGNTRRNCIESPSAAVAWLSAHCAIGHRPCAIKSGASASKTGRAPWPGRVGSKGNVKTSPIQILGLISESGQHRAGPRAPVRTRTHARAHADDWEIVPHLSCKSYERAGWLEASLPCLAGNLFKTGNRAVARGAAAQDVTKTSQWSPEDYDSNGRNRTRLGRVGDYEIARSASANYRELHAAFSKDSEELLDGRLSARIHLLCRIRTQSPEQGQKES